MKKTKIVHVISSLKIGGAEALVCSLIEQLSTEFEHHVIYFHDGPHRQTLTNMGIPVYHITGKLMQYDIFMVFKLISTIKKINPDILHGALWAANFFARIAGRLLNIKTINAVHLIVDDDGPVRNTLDYLTLHMADHLIAVSESVAASVTKKFKIPKNSITVIPNGINHYQLVAKSTQKALPRSILGLSPEHFIIGSVARFVPFKNHALLLDCFAQLVQKYPHARLLILGLGPLEEQLRAQAQKLEITDTVIFIIGQPACDYYPLFDCFVQPSAYEGLSIALLEALCFKLPVIVTGINTHHDVITHTTHGLVITPNNHAEFNHAVELLITQPLVCKQLGYAGFDLVQKQYTIQTMAHHYAGVFCEEL